MEDATTMVTEALALDWLHEECPHSDQPAQRGYTPGCGEESMPCRLCLAELIAARCKAEERADKDASDIEGLVMERDSLHDEVRAMRANCCSICAGSGLLLDGETSCVCRDGTAAGEAIALRERVRELEADADKDADDVQKLAESVAKLVAERDAARAELAELRAYLADTAPTRAPVTGEPNDREG